MQAEAYNGARTVNRFSVSLSVIFMVNEILVEGYNFHLVIVFYTFLGLENCWIYASTLVPPMVDWYIITNRLGSGCNCPD